MTHYVNTSYNRYKSGIPSPAPIKQSQKKDLVANPRKITPIPWRPPSKTPELVVSKAPFVPSWKPILNARILHPLPTVPAPGKVVQLPAIDRVKPALQPIISAKPAAALPHSPLTTTPAPHDGICIFIDGIFGFDEYSSAGFLTDHLIDACQQKVPIITAPNILLNALSGSTALQVKRDYDLYKHKLSEYAVLLPKGVSPKEFKLKGLELPPSSLSFKRALTKYDTFKTLFDDTPTEAKPRKVVYLCGHGSFLNRTTAGLEDFEYCDFIEHLHHRVYRLAVCVVSSCQPHGREPKIDGILLRRGLPNLDVRIYPSTSKRKILFGEFFEKAFSANFNTTPAKLQKIMSQFSTLLNGEREDSELILWDPKKAIVCGKPQPKTERAIMSYVETRRLQIQLAKSKKEHYEIPDHIQELILFPMKMPFGLIISGRELPAIFSNYGGRGVHYIPYFEVRKFMLINDVIEGCFQHTKGDKGKYMQTFGHHLFFFKEIRIEALSFYNVTVYLSPHVKTAKCDFTLSPYSPPKTSLIREWLDHALPYTHAVFENSSGQESVKTFLKELNENFYDLKIS